MDKREWNSIVASFVNTSILQTAEWAQVKQLTGWQPDFYTYKTKNGEIKAASLILCREQRLSKFGPKIRILYLPHGPLLNWNDEKMAKNVLNELVDYARQRKATYIKIDPQIIPVGKEPSSIPQCSIISNETIGWMKTAGWQVSPQQIQFRNTFWLDLTPPENELLGAMKQKTRYNVRLAERKGISIHKGGLDDLNLLYKMYLETSNRDGFIIRPQDYYLYVWEVFIKAGMALPLIAMMGDEPVAALILFYFARKSYFLYGMSTNRHREKMPNYLLQWEAIRISKQLGCEIYDLWGAPDIFEESQKMWGVYRFKEGLGGEIIETIGAYDFPVDKFSYRIIQTLLPAAQRITRLIRKRQMQEEAGQM